MSDVVVQGPRKEVTPGFSSFVHAFVYALAGGKRSLQSWGLEERWGWVPRNEAPTPSKGNYSGKTRAIESGGSIVPSTQSRPSFQRPTGRSQVSFSGPSTSAYPHGLSESPAPAPPSVSTSLSTRTIHLPRAPQTPSAHHPPMNRPDSESSPESVSSADIPPAGRCPSSPAVGFY